MSYLQEVAQEMDKVSWPDRDELISNTLLTLGVSLAISLFIFLIDRGISTILDVLYA